MITATTLMPRKKETLVAKLSLISLMDIFTILVFFLLLNSGETQTIETAKFVALPDSISGKTLHDELSIFVGEEKIVIDKDEIAQVSDILKAPGESITGLVEKLKEYKESLGELTEYQKQAGLSITLMADKHVSYEILKSVMETCREQDFRNISLAVNSVQVPMSQLSRSPELASGVTDEQTLVDGQSPVLSGDQMPKDTRDNVGEG